MHTTTETKCPLMARMQNAMLEDIKTKVARLEREHAEWKARPATQLSVYGFRRANAKAAGGRRG